MVKGEFAAQHEPLDRMRQALVAARPKSIDELGDDLKGRLLTLLLRVGRQDKVQEDEEKEAARKKALEGLARVWLALGDARRAANALQVAGQEAAAAALLDKSGDWRSKVALHRATGEHAEAARVLEAEGEHAEAAEAYAEAGDSEGHLRMLVKLGDESKVVEAIAALPKEKAEEAALRHGVLDAWAKVLTERQDWPALARLYQGYGQHDIAARAWEEAGDFRRAMKAYRQAGDAEGHDRCLARLVDHHKEKNDYLGAAKILAGAGKLDAAADFAAEKHPEQAHRWFVEGGYFDRALELARREARKAEGHEDYKLRATWLERAGDFVSAATLWEGMNELESAKRCYEAAKAWEPAARCAESLGKLDEAVELFYRAGRSDEAERVKLLA
jgi:tetratricopeptide (TPR) repeat protein